MNTYHLTYTPYGEQSILIQWPSKIDKGILKDIIHFKEKIIDASDRDIVYVNNSYNSLLIFYKNALLKAEEKISSLRVLYRSERQAASQKKAYKLWRIPVCYDSSFALDMELLCSKKHFSAIDIIRRHTQPTYTVYFTGFLPGFMYLGGLDKVLYFPRKTSPRSSVAQGAVGIGGEQTGIYPRKSPGGWNIIGNSPIHFFDASKGVPCFAKAGDKIIFYPIDIGQYNHIADRVKGNTFDIAFEVFHD